MTTIAQLVIEASVDPSGVRVGLNTSLDILRTYSKRATEALNSSFEEASPVDAATNYVALLRRTFERQQTVLKESLFTGALSEDAYTTAALQNSAAYNAALTAALRKSSAFDAPAAREIIVNAYDETGRRAGLAFERQMQAAALRAREEMTAASSVTRIGAAGGFTSALGNAGLLAERTGLQFTGLGERGARMGIAVAFGMEQLANGSEHGMNRALRAVATFGLAFGPEGLIISALATGTLALIDYFHKAEKEAEASSKRIRAHIAEAANAGRADDLQQQARIALLGQPYDSNKNLVKNSDLVKGAFAGSLADLLAQQRVLQQQIDDAPNLIRKSKLAQDMLALEARIAPLRDTFNAIQTAALNVANQPADNAGKLASIDVSAMSPDAKDHSVRDANKAWREHIEAVRAVVDSYKDLEVEHVATTTDANKLIAAYQGISKELDGMTNKSSKHAADLLKLRHEFEATRIVSRTAGPMADLLGTPTTPHALAGKPEDAERTAQSLTEQAKILRDTGAQTSDTYTRIISALAIVDRYLSDQNTREGLTVARLNEQLAIRREMDASRTLVMPTLTDPSLSAQVARAKEDAARAQTARATGAVNAGELEARANAEREHAVGLIRNIVQESTNWANITDDERANLAGLLDLLNQLGEGTQKTASGFAGVLEGVRGIVDAASGLGKIPLALHEAVTSGEHLVSSLQQIDKIRNKANAPGGGGLSDIGNLLGMAGAVTGGIGAAVGVIGGIASAFSQHDAILDANNQKLTELRQALIDTKGVSGQQTALEDIRKWAASIQAMGLNPFSMTSGNGNQGLDDIVKASGLSVDQFNKIASDLGIQFGKGTAWLEQFEQALQIAVGASTKFSDSLDDQRAEADLVARVNGQTSPSAKLSEELALLGQFAPKIRDQLGNIDVATADGRAQLQKALQALVGQIVAGTLTPDELGRLKGVKDLAAIIDNLETGLGSLTSAAGAAASAINGVSWYKVNQAIYDVAPTIQRPATSGGMQPGGPSDTRPSIPTSGTGTGGGIAMYGDLVIHTPETDPEKLRQIVLRGMQRRAQSLTGRSENWAQIQS